MADVSDLDGFIKAAKQQGATDEFLVAMLREKGWPSKEVYLLLARHYAKLTGVAIAEPPSRLESAREAFFHLLAFASLGTWEFALGWVWFSLISAWLPDAAIDRQTDFSLGQISWQLAWIIVAFPVFVWATRSILGDLLENPDKAESGVKRWVTNSGLLLMALAFMVDLVTFVSTLLQGQLTLRFSMDCLVVFVLAGAVFLYYSRPLGKSRTLPPLVWNRAFASVAGIAILITLALGFWLNGSPASVRVMSEDNRRTRDLYELALRIKYVSHDTASFAAPADLGVLRMEKTDPVTGRPYDYHGMGGRRYQLCAQFGAASERRPGGGESAAFWVHSSGRQCFVFETTQDPLYPPNYFRQ